MVNKRKLLLFHNQRDNKNYVSRRIVVALLEANKIHTIKCGVVILSKIFEGVSEKPPKKQFQFIILKLLNRGRTAEKRYLNDFFATYKRPAKNLEYISPSFAFTENQ